MTNTPDELEPLVDEFKNHVWNHMEDPFQVGFDQRRALSDEELAVLIRAVRAVRDSKSEGDLVRGLESLLRDDPEAIYPLMQLLGLTRNKIITDLRGALATNQEAKVPGKAHSLVERPEVWKAAGPYLAKRIRVVLAHLVAIEDEGALVGALEAMNQATWPGWVRQERAKRQGGEAEGRLAILLASLGIPFEPEEKKDNPLCPDATIDGVSFDIVVPTVEDPGMCVKATVHTANIGQYGESKDALEVAEARQVLNQRSPTPQLVALIDGVGFFSNTAGLHGVLGGADEFCQFATLWKGAVVAAHASGRKVALVLPDPDRHQGFLDRYSDSVELLERIDDDPNWQDAGEAMIRPA